MSDRSVRERTSGMRNSCARFHGDLRSDLAFPVRPRATGRSHLTRLPALYRERNATIDALLATQSREFARDRLICNAPHGRRIEFKGIAGAKRSETGFATAASSETVTKQSKVTERSDARRLPIRQPRAWRAIRDTVWAPHKAVARLRRGGPDRLPEAGRQGPAPEISLQFNISRTHLLLIDISIRLTLR